MAGQHPARPVRGGGAVSLYAKAQGFHVVAADISERSCIVTRALVANSSCRLTRGQVLGLFRESEGDCPRRAAELVPEIFTVEQAVGSQNSIRPVLKGFRGPAGAIYLGK